MENPIPILCQSERYVSAMSMGNLIRADQKSESNPEMIGMKD